MMLLAVFCATGAWAQKKAAGGGYSNQIVVVSDIHVMAPELLPEGAETQEAWTTYYAGERKMLQESVAIFDQFIQKMMALQPRVLLITGDLTKDGERLSHEYVRNSLYNLTYYGTRVLVIPGNHDFGGSGKATKFNADGTTEPAEVLTTDDFKDFYDGFGYNDWESEYDPNSLSYVVEPMEGLVVLAIDSHTASISEATLEWLCTKAKEARNAGKQVIAMMHHPLFPHITGANLFIDTYTVDGYETVRDALIDAGVNTILTGHFHTSDIAKDWNDDESKAVYDINTGSLISYPFDYRVLTPSNDFMTFQVATQTLTPTGMTADDAKAWLKDRTKTIATQKMNSKAGALAAMVGTQIDNVAEFASNLYILHSEGDENVSNDRETVATVYEGYKNDPTYSAIFSYGGITDESIYSILDDKSNYGTDKSNQTADRSLSIAMPEVGPFLPSGPGTITISDDKEGSADLPISASHKYVLTQQQFNAQQINHAKGDIWSLGLQTEKGDVTRNLTIYVTTPEQSTYSDYGWWTVTDADCVFSGEVTFTSGQWTTIYFTKPVQYDGKSNLIITIDDNTGESSGSWGVLSCYTIKGSHSYAYSDKADIDPKDYSTLESVSSWNKGTVSYQSKIQLTFGDLPTPAGLTVSDIGDVSAKMSTTLRGDATAWNLRYRKVGIEDWTVASGITESSKLISGLTAATKYEAQVQGIFAEDNLSDWTELVTFTTACCPVEEQGEIIYAFNSNYENYYGYAVQFMDVTDANNPVEVAYINPPGYGLYGGSITLCCGHKYKVNWIADPEHPNLYKSYSFSLLFEPGDQFFSMARGEAPENTGELTEFIMDCTPYCAPKPKTFTVTGTTYNSATITFASETKTGEVVYSTEAGFDPDAVTPTSVDFDAIVSNNEFDYNPANSSLTLTGLESLTLYYVRVRSICTEGVGHSRWSDPIQVITNTKYASPSRVIASPVDSKTENTAWKRNGIEGKNNVNYRTHGASSPAGAPMFIDLDGDGETFDGWGGTSYGSYGRQGVDNVIAIANVPANAMVSWNAADANSAKAGGNTVRFQYGFVKQTKKYGDSDEEIAAAQSAVTGALQSQKQEEQEVQQDAEKLKELLDEAKTLEKEIEEQSADGFIPLPLKLKLYKLEKQIEALQQASQTKNAGDISVTPSGNTEQSSEARNMTRAPGEEEEYYFFFIRHTEADEILLVKDITITPAENIGEWITIPNVEDVEYTLAGLKPNTQYEVMVEPVYDSGAIGIASPITIFTTIGEEADPMESEFSVAEDKKVQFARGNLQHEGDMLAGTWSMAKQQYDMLGQDNVDKPENDNSSYTAELVDLFCWSTAKNYSGLYFFAYDEEEEANRYFQGDFKDWGTITGLVSDLGSGWSTLSKDEWDYLLNERTNAANLKSLATVAGVQGLILLPDDWKDDTPAGTFTAEEWATLEKDGAVFLPTAGQMTQTYDQTEYVTTTTVSNDGVEGFYWTSTPFDDNAGLNAYVLNFSATNATPETDVNRRIASAVRLVKVVEAKKEPGDVNGDTDIDALDIQDVITLMVNDEYSEAADVNGDKVVDALDIQDIISIIVAQ